MNIYREAILESGALELGEFVHANGGRSNNTLNMNRLFERGNEERLETVLNGLEKIVFRHDPELFVGIPTGGEKWAEELASSDHLDLPVAYLDKKVDLPGKKSYKYQRNLDEDRVLWVDRLVVVKDVFNKFTSTRGVLALPDILRRTRLVAAVWDRGDDHARPKIKVPFKALVSEYIPPVLYKGDELFEYGKETEEAK